MVFGTLVGSVAGYFGGIVDEILMRFTDMFLAFPALILAIAIAASLGRELHWTMVALATVFWPWYARLVRGQILSIRERDLRHGCGEHRTVRTSPAGQTYFAERRFGRSSSSSRSTSVTRSWRPARSRSSASARNRHPRNGAR